MKKEVIICDICERKKPKTILHDGENEWYVCPTCGIEIASISHHCKCGQAIDWEI